MQEITKEKAMIITIHIVGWLIFIAISIINESELLSFISKRPFAYILNYLLLIIYFYVNLNCIVPAFLSKKKVLAFVGMTVAAFLIICVFIPWFFHHFINFNPPHFQERPPMLIPQEGEGLRKIPRLSPHEVMERLHFFKSFTYFLIVFTISTGIKVITQWYKEKQRLTELEVSRVEAELSFLKSQIHPHFLFNSLNSIYYLSISKDDKAPKAIMSLSSFLRFVTLESDKKFIPLEKEIEILEEYLNLQSLRASENVDLHFSVEGNINYRKIMPLTFIPFVENAFKYGISAHIDSFIHINIAINKGVLEFNISNSIISEKKDIVQSKVGLDNIKKRLELAYPKRYILDIKSDSQVFKIFLKIKL